MNRIGGNEIHLWVANDEQIREPEFLKSYHEMLSYEEVEKQRRFHFEKHRHQYLITRALLRSALSYYANDEIRPEEWTFCENGYGKPYISNAGFKNTLSFNLSHSEKMIVLAVTDGRDVGVDVEWLLRDGKTVELADSFFSPKEVEQLVALPLELQSDRFFDLWTLKEAYIKACGMGLSIPLDQFSYEFVESKGINISFAKERYDQPDDWQFWQIRPCETHKIAVAIKQAACHKPYTISMRKAVPMRRMIGVDYPIFRQSNNSYSAVAKPL